MAVGELFVAQIAGETLAAAGETEPAVRVLVVLAGPCGRQRLPEDQGSVELCGAPEHTTAANGPCSGRAESRSTDSPGPCPAHVPCLPPGPCLVVLGPCRALAAGGLAVTNAATWYVAAIRLWQLWQSLSVGRPGCRSLKVPEEPQEEHWAPKMDGSTRSRGRHPLHLSTATTLDASCAIRGWKAAPSPSLQWGQWCGPGLSNQPPGPRGTAEGGTRLASSLRALTLACAKPTSGIDRIRGQAEVEGAATSLTDRLQGQAERLHYVAPVQSQTLQDQPSTR